MRLSPHFTLGEMTRSETASRHGIANDPDEAALRNLTALCVLVLEKIRAHYRSPVLISSGYRSPEVNRKVGGSSNSQHTAGEAADFEVAGWDHLTVVRYIVNVLEFDQVIIEYCTCDSERPDRCRGWVHVSYTSDRQNRGAILRAKAGRSGKGPAYQRIAPSQIPDAAA